MNDKSLIGVRLGDFQILRRLGRGGMAEVYAARQLSLRREVAVKVLRPEFAKDEDYVRRFRREARSAAKLNHPNIVTVLDVGSQDDVTYMVQELVDGENLKVIVEQSGAFPPESVREILVSVALALVEADSAGIVHRDIKPENLIRSSNGILKVADFGLARVTVGGESSMAGMTQVGMTLGTPRYMSPEQIQGREVDARSDLYSLGVTAYHLLTGKPPFDAEDPVALAVKHLHDIPMPLESARASTTGKHEIIADDLIAIIGRLMAKSPDDRFASASDLLHTLTGDHSLTSPSMLMSHRAGVAARLQRATSQAAIFRRRQRQSMLVAAAIAVGLGLTFYHWLSQGNQASLVDQIQVDTVLKQSDVQKQYLVAMQRNDEAGWRAIAKFFPAAASAVNADYAAKSELQLARLLGTTGRTSEAQAILHEMQSNEKTERLYRVLASAYELMIVLGSDQTTDSMDLVQRLQADVKQLKQNSPSDHELFLRLAPQSVQLMLDIGQDS
jgi:eukaryotic-like serine/threonine-protein kinase